MNHDQATQAVELGQRVTLISAHDRTTIHAEGTVKAYCDAPTVLVITDHGERIHWRADLAQPVEDDQ